jgi:hypothetical protein
VQAGRDETSPGLILPVMVITVIGASGYTGRIICQKLASENLKFNVTSRRAEQLSRLKNEFKGINRSFELDLLNELSAQNVVENSEVIVNCVGPFLETGYTLVDACGRAGVIYLDITGEYEFAKALYSPDGGKVGMFPSCSFESFLADLIMQWAEREYGKIISSFVFYRSANSRPSTGTRKTMKLAPFREKAIIREGKTVKIENDDLFLRIDDEVFKSILITLPELLYMSVRYGVVEGGSYITLTGSQSEFIDMTRPVNIQDKSEVIKKLERMHRKDPTQDERLNHRYWIYIHFEFANGLIKSFELSGKDMYGITADIIFETLTRISLNEGKIDQFKYPSQLFYFGEMELLKKLGIAFREINLEISQ